MYNGTNPKAIRSQQLLADAFIELLKEREYGQISVFDICQTASLSRQTFYNFFNSKEEIVRFYFKNQFITNDFDDINDAVGYYSVFLQKNEIVLNKIFENGLEGLITQEIVESFLQNSKKLDLSTKSDLIYYKRAVLAGALSQMLSQWFSSGMATPLKTLCSFISDVFDFSPTLYTPPENEVYEEETFEEEEAETEEQTEEGGEHEQKQMPLFLL